MWCPRRLSCVGHGRAVLHEADQAGGQVRRRNVRWNYYNFGFQMIHWILHFTFIFIITVLLVLQTRRDTGTSTLEKAVDLIVQASGLSISLDDLMIHVRECNNPYPSNESSIPLDSPFFKFHCRPCAEGYNASRSTNTLPCTDYLPLD